ncbi:MAG TPA: tetratricopeptide repeat protein, partial [Phycisphaerae bacterium]
VEKSAEAARLDPQRYGPQRAAAYERAAARANTAGDLANYVRYLELAVDASEPLADLHCRLGNAYWETGRKDDAARHWRITLELEPEYRDRDRLLGLLRDLAALKRGPALDAERGN